MSELGAPYVAVVGRSGPAFGRLGGVRRAVLELGGLPADALGDGLPDLGVVEPPEPAPVEREPSRARVPGSTREPRQALARACQLRALPLPQLGYVWERERRWAFDLAWPHPRVAVVLDGGVRLGGRNVPGAGWIRDATRLNLAAIEGWMVLRVTPAQIADGQAVQWIARALASPWRRL
jgi:hypothetical protein